MVKNLPINAGNPGLIPGWEDPLEKGMAIHSNILAWRMPRTKETGGLSPWGHKESDMTKRLTHTGVFVSLSVLHSV